MTEFKKNDPMLRQHMLVIRYLVIYLCVTIEGRVVEATPVNAPFKAPSDAVVKDLKRLEVSKSERAEFNILKGPPSPSDLYQITRPQHSSQAQLEACADCHTDIVENFKRTFMSRALTYPTLDQVIEDFRGSRGVIIHPVTRVGYRATIDDQGRWWQEEFDPEGTYLRRVEVKYLIGSGNNTRSYIGEIDGELFELPLTWYSATEQREGLWDMSPGYERADHFRFSRPVKADCLFCHNDLTPMTDGRLSGFKEDLAPGITCVRCHGDGQAHIDARFEGKEWLDQPDPTILNPAHLPLGRQQQICEQCHLSGEARALMPGQRWDRYDPRTPLEDYVRIYAFPAENTIEGSKTADGSKAQHIVASSTFSIASHAERMKLSACAQGGRPFTCTTCHDPHAPDSHDSYQRACLSCHQNQSHARIQADAYSAHQGKPCFSCHMNSSGTSDIPHVKMTDHWVRRQPEIKGLTTISHSPNLSSILPELNPDLETYRDGLLGLAYADLVRFNQRNEFAPKALQLLAQAARRHPSWPELWSSLGEISSMLGDRIAALAAYSKYSALRPQDEFYRLREASILNVTGQQARAQGILRDLISRRPSNYFAIELLANIHLQTKQYQEADRLYEEADRYGPHAHSIPHNRGFLSLLQGDLARARAHFIEGNRRDGVSREGPFYLGLVSAAEGRHQDAVKSYRSALNRDPKFSQAYEQLARSLLTLKDEVGAIETLRTWIQRDARSVNARLWLAQLLDRAGRYQEVYDLLSTAARQLSDPRLSQALKVATDRLKLAPNQPALAPHRQ
jgi:tetratricopeptide (TPR) repeat protein